MLVCIVCNLSFVYAHPYHIKLQVTSNIGRKVGVHVYM